MGSDKQIKGHRSKDMGPKRGERKGTLGKIIKLSENALFSLLGSRPRANHIKTFKPLSIQSYRAEPAAVNSTPTYNPRNSPNPASSRRAAQSGRPRVERGQGNTARGGATGGGARPIGDNRAAYSSASEGRRAQSELLPALIQQETFNPAKFLWMGGPAFAESLEQLDRVRAALHSLGIEFLRTRACPPHIRGEGVFRYLESGLHLLRRTAIKYNLNLVCEAPSEQALLLIADFADVIEIPSTQVFNLRFLTRAASLNRALFIPRDPFVPVEQFLEAVHQLHLRGAREVVIGECGVRGISGELENVFDVTVIPRLRAALPYPVVVIVPLLATTNEAIDAVMSSAAAIGGDGLVVNPFSHDILSKMAKVQAMRHTLNACNHSGASQSLLASSNKEARLLKYRRA